MRLPSDQDLADQLAGVFAFSDFVADSCIRDPLLLTQLWNGGDLRQAPAAGAYGRRLYAFLEGTADIDDLAGRLRRFRRREMVAIAWRDLTGKADLAATMAALSELAEACLNQALAWLYARQCADQTPPPPRTDPSYGWSSWLSANWAHGN